jgi:transcriptional regulator with XRE-family HTH domain
MARTTVFQKKIPAALNAAIVEFSARLQMARKRRKLSIRQVADKLGVGVRAVSDAEKGKPTTAVSTYIGLLWVYGLLGDMKNVANPMNDIEGLRLEALAKNKSIKSELDNDF